MSGDKPEDGTRDSSLSDHVSPQQQEDQELQEASVDVSDPVPTNDPIIDSSELEEETVNLDDIALVPSESIERAEVALAQQAAAAALSVGMNIGSGSLIEVEPSHIPTEWDVKSTKRKSQLNEGLINRSTRHGILSSIPMVCKDHECLYKQHCIWQQRGEVTRGERCILEITKLIEASQRYYKEFAIDPADPGMRVDAAMVQQLLTMEILIDRCNMLLATQDMIENVDVAIDPRSGDVLSQPQLHKAAELLPKYMRKHSELLNQLNATRRDKANTQANSGASAADLMKAMLQQAIAAKTRIELMRSGQFEQAEEMGELIEYKEPGDFPQLNEE